MRDFHPGIRTTSAAALFPLQRTHIVAARSRIADQVMMTPLLRLRDERLGSEVWLKLEMLQQIGSMKLRGVLNCVRSTSPEEIAKGLVTTSSGNLGRAVAWVAQLVGVPATVAMPNTAPARKVAAVEELGARVIRLSPVDWWAAMLASQVEDLQGHFIHPVLDSKVLEGVATLGIEILEQAPDVETVLLPYGGGALATGVASALRLWGSKAKVVACEPATAAPLTASMMAQQNCRVEAKPTIVDAAGGPELLPGMWDVARELLHQAVAVPDAATAEAMRLLAQRSCVVAEGAAALPVGAALTYPVVSGRTVCIISGGNVDTSLFAKVLAGRPALG